MARRHIERLVLAHIHMSAPSGAAGAADGRHAARSNVELPICHEKGSEMFSNKESPAEHVPRPNERSGKMIVFSPRG